MEPEEPDPRRRCPFCSPTKPRLLDGDEAVPVDALERAQADGELEALRETVANQQQTIQELCEDLDEERNAASSAASETMSMILRLQREKAEVLIEAKQFRRFAEEKFEHDEKEIEEFQEELCERDEAIEALSREVQELRERFVGITVGSESRLDCEISADGLSDEGRDLETSRLKEDLEASMNGVSEHIQPEICDAEVLEKEVVLGNSSNSVDNREEAEIPVPVECPSEGGGDDSSDRVYTIYAVDGVPEASPAERVRAGILTGQRDLRFGEAEFTELNRRVQALEVDREITRQAIVNMKAENTQLLLLRDISQNLCRMMVQPAIVNMERGQLVKQQASAGGFSLLSLFKWLLSFLFFWKRKPKPTQPRLPARDACVTSSNNMRLFLLLGKSPLFQKLRCLPRTQGQVFS